MRLKKIRLFGIIVFSILFLSSELYADTRTASNNGNWNNTATWGGEAQPTADDDVIINSGISVTVNVASAECATLTFASNSSTSVLTINGTNSLTVSGLIYMPQPTSSNRHCNVWVNSGTLTCGSVQMTTTSTTRRNVFYITTGTMTITGSVTVAGTGCRFVFQDAGVLNIGGTTSGTPQLTNYSGCEVNYTGDVNQDIFEVDYYNLGFSGTGTKTLNDNVDVDESLTLEGGVLNNSSGNLTMAGGTTIYRYQEGSVVTFLDFDGTVDIVYTGASAVTTGYEIPLEDDVVNDLTANASGVTQGQLTLTSAYLLTENFSNMAGTWTGDYGGQISNSGHENDDNGWTEAPNTFMEHHEVDSFSFWIWTFWYQTGVVEGRYLGGDNSSTYYEASVIQSIDNFGLTNVDISWDQTIDDKNGSTYPYTLKVQIGPTSGGPWTDLYSVSPTSDISGTQILEDYELDDGKDFYVRLYATGYTYGLNDWYIDNLTIYGEADPDPVPTTVTINGDLDLSGGTYDIAGNSLELNGTITASDDDIIGSSTSDLTIGGTGTNLSIPRISGGLNDLKISRPNGATLSEGYTISGDIIVETGSSLDADSYTHTVGGNIINSGTFTTSGDISVGTDLYSSGSFNGSGATLSVPGDLTNTGTFDATSTTITVGGNFTNDDTFDATSGSMTFDGSSTQSILGSGTSTTLGDVIFDNTPAVVDSLEGLLTVSGSLTVNATSAFEISSASDVTVVGTFTYNSATDLILRSDTLSTASLIHSTAGISGEVERYMIGDRWHVVSQAVSGQSINSFITDVDNNIPTSGANYGMMEYSESDDEWQFFTAATPGNLTPGEGYLLRNTANDVVTTYGTLNVAKVDISVSQDMYGWDALGNPFPSSIGVREDATTSDDFLTYNAAQFDPSFAVLYVWDEPAVREPYHTYWVVVGNSGFSSSKTELDQAYLQPGQGFLVKAKDGGGTMTFTTDMRSHGDSDTHFKTSREPWPGIILKVSNETKSASTSITYHENMTLGLDITYDAGLFGGNPNFRLYSHLVEDNGVNFMLQCLPDDNDTIIIPIGFDYKDGGMVTFSSESILLPDSFRVIIEDRLLGVFTNLEEPSSAYSTTVEENFSGIGRFYLHTYLDSKETEQPEEPEEPEEPVAVNDINTSSIYIYSYGSEIFIRGEINGNTHVKLYDLAGSLIRTYELTQTDINILPATGIRKGIYLVKVEGKGISKTGKIIL
ncbi:MAG: T9SS type A sorting domain-containing protein [Bacteroidales bacterium]|nr:T9SS type A sorting domain-containing protein [Bacteroidales bacterium]